MSSNKNKLPWWLRWLLIFPAIILALLYLLNKLGLDIFKIGDAFGWNLETSNGQGEGNSYEGYNTKLDGEKLDYINKWVQTMYDHIHKTPNKFIPQVVNDFQNFSNEHKLYAIEVWILKFGHKKYTQGSRYRLNDLLLDISPSNESYDNSIMDILNIEDQFEPIDYKSWSAPWGSIVFT
jgi:hypothetical protein